MNRFWKVWVAWGGNGWFMQANGADAECATWEEAMGRADAYKQANPDARVNVCGPFARFVPMPDKETPPDVRPEPDAVGDRPGDP